MSAMVRLISLNCLSLKTLQILRFPQKKAWALFLGDAQFGKRLVKNLVKNVAQASNAGRKPPYDAPFPLSEISPCVKGVWHL